MRDPHKYTWIDPDREPDRLSPGQCLAIVFVGCLMFWAGFVALFCWAVPFVRWLFS